MAPYDQLGRSDSTPSADLPQKVLGWCIEGLQEGDYYLRAQQGYGRASELRRMIMGDTRAAKVLELSSTSDNEIGRLYDVAGANLTDIRAFWQYETKNPRYEQHVRIQTSCIDWWFPRYGEGPTELIAKSALIYSIGVGNQKWNRSLQEISLDYRNPHDVMPIRPSGDFSSFQDCLSVVDRREMPVSAVRDMFPHAARYITMERDASVAAMMRTAETKIYGRSPLQIAQSMANPPVGRLGAIPVVDLFFTYVNDPSVNDGTSAVEMGDWGYAADGSSRRIALNDWSYKVEPGEPLYPLKRLIIWTRQMRMYDGPSHYWHALFPYSKFPLGVVPDSWFGRSPLWPCIPLQRSLDRMYQAIDNHVGKVLNPGKQAPKLGVSNADFRNYKTNMPGMTARYGPAGKIETDEIPPLDPIVETHIDRLLARMSKHVGEAQLAQLLSMGQIPEQGSIEKILFAMAPEIRAQSRALERFQREQGTMFAHNVMQFWGLGKRITMLGSDGETIEDYDIDPDSLVPAYTASDYDNTGRLKAGATKDPRPRMDRGREHGRQFSLFIKPASMLNSAQTMERMLYLALRNNLDLDLYTVLKKIDVPGLGPEPKGNVIERTVKEKMGILPGMPPPMPMVPPGGPSEGPGAGGGGGQGSGGGDPAGGNDNNAPRDGQNPAGPQHGPGHPASFQQAPEMRSDGRTKMSP